MKLQVSNTNAPVWRDVMVKSDLPAKLKPLEVLSRNLWWVWNSEGKSLFRDLNPDLWRAVGENPVMLLQQLGFERLQEILKDAKLMERIEKVYADFKAYMKVPMRKDVPSVSYVSMEYGLCNALKIYSGGLGVLAGDYIKEASDSCVDMTAVGFLYRYGYFTQTLSVDGQQIANYEPQDFNMLPLEQVLDADGKPTVREVAILFENYLWRGNRSTKRSADNFNAFRSNNYPELAKIGLGIHFRRTSLTHTDKGGGLEIYPEMDTNVMAIDLFPGLSRCVVEHMLAAPGIKGVVLRTYGAGNGPSEKWFLDALTQAVANGIVIVNVTQWVNGGVYPRRYLTGDKIASTGVVSGHDITFEAAIAKLMHLFGRGFTPAEVRKRFSRPISGEITVTKHSK